MYRSLVSICGLTMASLMLLVGCTKSVPDPVKAALDQPGSFELVSLDPIQVSGPQPKSQELLHGYRVLGKLKVANTNDQNQLREAFYQAIGEGGTPNRCFLPRHAIRVPKGGSFVDMLICFECRQTHVYFNGERIEQLTMDDSAQPAFDDILTAANVPLPTK